VYQQQPVPCCSQHCIQLLTVGYIIEVTVVCILSSLSILLPVVTVFASSVGLNFTKETRLQCVLHDAAAGAAWYTGDVLYCSAAVLLPAAISTCTAQSAFCLWHSLLLYTVFTGSSPQVAQLAGLPCPVWQHDVKHHPAAVAHSLTHSLTHLLRGKITHSHIQLLTRPALFHSLPPSFTHSFTHSLSPSLTPSLPPSLTPSLTPEVRETYALHGTQFCCAVLAIRGGVAGASQGRQWGRQAGTSAK
jgi:hypothetical protein